MAGPILSMRGIVKRFGDVQANDGIDLDIHAGRILGLLGENGSGKSTLMNILFGLIAPDQGRIVCKGRDLAGHGPALAAACGIAMIHQNGMLVDALSVAENVMLGWPAAGRWLRRAEVCRRLHAISATFGLDIDPAALVGRLSAGQRQLLEIIRAVLHGAEILILDEPTTSLATIEVDQLLRTLSRLRAQGCAVIYISHKLREVTAMCDDVVILRDGRVAWRGAVADHSAAALAALLAGPAAPPADHRPSPCGADARLSCRALSAGGLGPLDMAVHAGEVLGIVGLDDGSQTALAETLAGLRPARSGQILLDGQDITGASIRSRVASGLAYVPADRVRTGVVPAMSVGENLAMRDIASGSRAGGAWLHRGRSQQAAARLIAEYGIRTGGPGQPVHQLSGGNQQKIVLARELSRRPAAVVAHQAVSGLDPGAAAFVRNALRERARDGAAVLYLATDADEVLDIADRIAVMAAGRIGRPVSRHAVDPAQIRLRMSEAAAA